MSFPKVRDRGLAGSDSLIVIHDHEASAGYASIEGLEGGHRRFVHVAVEPKDGYSTDWRGWKRLGKPSLKKADMIVKQPKPPKILLDRLDTDPQFLVGVVRVAPVLGIECLVRSRETTEGVREPHDSVFDAMRSENCPRKDGRAPSPNSRFHEIARHTVPNSSEQAVGDIRQPTQTDHRHRALGPVAAFLPFPAYGGWVKLGTSMFAERQAAPTQPRY
jgi:hypothetical protein